MPMVKFTFWATLVRVCCVVATISRQICCRNVSGLRVASNRCAHLAISCDLFHMPLLRQKGCSGICGGPRPRSNAFGRGAL